MKDKEHQSYQVLRKIRTYLKNGKSWRSLVKYITKIGKGDSILHSEMKLLFLINNSILTKIENKIVLTKFGENITNDPYNCFMWIAEIEPQILRIITLLDVEKELTYSELTLALGIESKNQLYCPMHWLKSLGLLSFKKTKERLWKLTKKGEIYFSEYIKRK